MAGKKDFFGRLVRTYGAAFATRWRLKANHSRRASGDLARLAKIEHLSAFHKVLVHTIQQKLFFSAERANYRFFCFAKITFQLSL